MNGLTRFVLKRPITTLMAVLCLIVFGYTSVTSMSLENIPDMEMPVLMVMTTYSGVLVRLVQRMMKLLSQPKKLVAMILSCSCRNPG